jgi:integrase
MAKRGNNDGTIRQRKDGRWEARVTIGYNPNGAQIRRSVYGATQAEVQSKLRDTLQRIEKGLYTEPTKITVAEWVENWCENYGATHWRAKTLEVHRDNVRLHIKPFFGKTLLSKLRPDKVQAFINEQIKKGASPGSVRKRMEPIKGALKQAVANRLIPFNPADNVILPAANQREISFLSVEEQQKLLSVLPDTTAGRAIRFILFTGLRASEICGLRWGDIEEKAFHIRCSAQYVRNQNAEGIKQTLVLAPPKTKAGRRSIPLTNASKSILDAQRLSQLKARMRAGAVWQGGEPGEGDMPVFATEIGTHYDRGNLDRALRNCLKEAGLPSRGLHALRHTFATNWVRSGSDLRTLSEILGHTKVSFTMQQYVHTDMNTKLEGLLAVENLA